MEKPNNAVMELNLDEAITTYRALITSKNFNMVYNQPLEDLIEKYETVILKHIPDKELVQILRNME